MKTIFKNTCLLFLLLSLGSCVKDDTVDTFGELNEVSFGKMDSKYSVMLYDKLHIPLNITTSMGDEANLSYAWYIYTPTSRLEADTLSREKDLDIVIDPSKAVPGEDYTLGVKVTDTTTGVYYRKDMKLEVTSQFTKGTILLCKENEKIELNFLPFGKERELIENVYSRSNAGDHLTGNPLHVYAIDPNKYAPYMKQVLIFCENQDGGVILDPVTFEKIKPLRDAFESVENPGTLHPSLYVQHEIGIDYILLDGKICKRGVNMGSLDWEAPLVCTEGPGDYEVASHSWGIDYMQTFFDRKHKRLLQHFRWNMGALHQMKLSGADLSSFDPNNIGENMEMLCCGNLSGVNHYWMMMKNSVTDQLYVYKFQVNNGTFISKLKMELTEKHAPHINQAQHFSVNPNFTDVVMFSTRDKVYSLSLNLLDRTTTNIIEACQVDLSDKNMEITGFNFLPIDIEDVDTGRLSPTDQLRLYVKDNNLDKLKGGIVFYNVNTMGGIHADFLYSKTGFCDQVVDVAEKYN